MSQPFRTIKLNRKDYIILSKAIIDYAEISNSELSYQVIDVLEGINKQLEEQINSEEQNGTN